MTTTGHHAPNANAGVAGRPAPRTTGFAMPDRLIITIDGPAGTGKSTVSRELAHRLGLDLLDTGAMYRTAAAIVIDRNISTDDHAAVTDAVARCDLHFDWSADPPAMLCSGVDMMTRIRRPDITGVVSRIAAIPDLRRLMVRKQQLIAHQHPRLVAEGRDQGSVVFPDAHVKFFLTATPEVRARRRADQLAQTGVATSPAEQLSQILSRDHQDSTRTEGPLVRPEGAVDLDTSDLTFDQVVDELERLVRVRVSASEL